VIGVVLDVKVTTVSRFRHLPEVIGQDVQTAEVSGNRQRSTAGVSSNHHRSPVDDADANMVQGDLSLNVAGGVFADHRPGPGGHENSQAGKLSMVGR
jgi:hypothetical protein